MPDPIFTVDVTANAPGYNPGPNVAQRITPSVLRFLQLKGLISQQLRVCVPGIVQNFNPAAMTVTVLVAIAEQVQQNVNASFGTAANVNIQSQPLPIPVLTDVPVCLSTAGGWSFTFPIQKGDECLVIFCDTAIDSWFASGCPKVNTPQNPVSGRRHSLSDGIAIFGLRSTPNVLPDYSANSVQLRSNDGSTVIDLASAGITITSSTGNVTINAQTATVHGNTVNVTASDTVTITGNMINITGNNTISIGGTNTVTIAGVNWLLHGHSGVQTGAGRTGPVVP